MLPAPRGAERPGALRRLNAPRQAEVRCEGSVPSTLRQRGHWLAVESVLDCWRTDDRWWTSAPVARTYYELLLEDGRVATVFRDETQDVWWEQKYG